MLQSYNKLIILDIDANIGNIGGGVGEAYPGSTGGEIFNYYGTDTNANTAEGEYSTTIGFNNKNNGKYSFVGGHFNTVNDTEAENCLLFGYKNIIKDTTTHNVRSDNCILLGQENEINKTANASNRVNILIGSENDINLNGNSGHVYRNCVIGYKNVLTTYSSTQTKEYSQMFGNNLTFVGALNSQVIIGKYNNYSSSSADVIIACGHSSYPHNAIEITPQICKINNKLQLPTDTTEVNAITPALSNPASADDMTLVTKSHLGASLPMTHLSGAITGIDENSFPLDFTSYWTAARATDANMRISLRINGSCYSKSLYNCLAVDGSFECYRSSYDSGTQTTTFSRYRFGWDYANKALTLTGSMSWEMTDAGTISNVTHGLTGLVITIYQIETY